MVAGFYIAGYLVALNALTWGIFAWDKYCARMRYWRVPESSLLSLAFLGGTPAALAAMRMLRHKTRKQPFRSYLTRIAMLHSTLVILMALPLGRQIVYDLVGKFIA